MSEPLENAARRKDVLKHMIVQLHKGTAPDAVRKQLVRTLGQVPYTDVVEVEQELITEGPPVQEVLRLCDVHSEALRGTITLQGVKPVAAGHPVHTFKQENRALHGELKEEQILLMALDSTTHKPNPRSPLHRRNRMPQSTHLGSV